MLTMRILISMCLCSWLLGAEVSKDVSTGIWTELEEAVECNKVASNELLLLGKTLSSNGLSMEGVAVLEAKYRWDLEFRSTEQYLWINGIAGVAMGNDGVPNETDICPESCWHFDLVIDRKKGSVLLFETGS